MNTFSFKNRLSITLILLLSIAGFISSCSKKEDVMPDLGTTASGTYRLISASGTNISGGTVNLPATTTYTIVLTRTNASTVDFKITTTSSANIPGITLTSSSSTILLSYSDSSGSLSGSINNGTLVVTINYKSGGSDTYTAIKI